MVGITPSFFDPTNIWPCSSGRDLRFRSPLPRFRGTPFGDTTRIHGCCRRIGQIERAEPDAAW